MTTLAAEPSGLVSSQAADRRSSRRRAALVGLGKQALEDHVPGLLASDAAELVAVCALEPEVVREQQYQLRVPG